MKNTKKNLFTHGHLIFFVKVWWESTDLIILALVWNCKCQGWMKGINIRCIFCWINYKTTNITMYSLKTVCITWEYFICIFMTVCLTDSWMSRLKFFFSRCKQSIKYWNNLLFKLCAVHDLWWHVPSQVID